MPLLLCREVQCGFGDFLPSRRYGPNTPSPVVSRSVRRCPRVKMSKHSLTELTKAARRSASAARQTGVTVVVQSGGGGGKVCVCVGGGGGGGEQCECKQLYSIVFLPTWR